VGVLAVLLANGLAAFSAFLSVRPGDAPWPRHVQRAWPVEIIMGHIGASRLPSHWRAALLDQALRSPACPPLDTLLARQVCKTQRQDAMPWVSACARHHELPTLRVLL